MTAPSAAGLSPRPVLRMAFSTAPASERSHTWTLSMRASGTVTVATWLSGMRAAIGFDHHRLEQAGAGAAGAQARQFVA